MTPAGAASVRPSLIVPSLSRFTAGVAVLIIMTCPAAGQNISPPISIPAETSLVAGEVVISGNEKTKEFVILREMTLKPGSVITRELMEYDKNRIYSLGLFNDVQLRLERAVSGTWAVHVIVHERWYIFPFPVFGLRDRDWSKLYFGLGVLHNNFRGRNEKLYASAVFGYDPSFQLAYRNPFLSDDGSHFIEGRIGYNKVRNRSITAKDGSMDFDERHCSLSITGGKRFGIEQTAWLTAGYEYVEIRDNAPGRTIDSDGIDRFPVVGVGYLYDSRDLKEYAGTGTFLRGTVTKYGVPGDDLDIVRYAADAREYVPIAGGLTMKGRIFTDLVAAGKTPSYNRTYFGYGERIRGHFDEVTEGESIFGMTAEFHYPLLDPVYLKVGFVPPEFGLWKFGVTAALFADAGTVWFRDEPFALNRLSKGYGGGIHFLLPYGAVVRIEYGFNEAWRGEFILDVGAGL